MEATRLFCRLCASITPNKNLLSFDSMRGDSAELIMAVQRIHPSICHGDALPQTVCKPCARRVRMLATFIREVEEAQVILARQFALQQPVKQEDHAEHDVISEVCSEIKKKNCEPVKEITMLKVKEELEIEEYEPPQDIIVSVDIKSENQFNLTGKSSHFENFDSKTEMPCGSGKIENPQTIEYSNTLLDKKHMGVAEFKNQSKNRSSIKIMNFKIIDTPYPQWSDFWCCFRCDKNYKTLYELRDHSIDAHAQCVVFKCSICPKRLRKFYGFLMHMKLHCERLEHCCEYCNVTFHSKSDVALHKGIEHPNEKKKYRCVKCGVEFDNFVDLKCHRDSFTRVIVVNPEHRNYICDNCGAVCAMKSHLALHMMKHYPNRYHCKICNKNFRQKSILVGHETNVHGSGNKYICQICGKTFASSSNMKAHVDIHMGIKRHSCDICEKTFRTHNQMRNHQLSHGGPSLHTCQICGKSFRYKSCLHQHKNIHSDVKPYSCEICPKDFSNWANFNKHMKRIHGKNMAKNKLMKDNDMETQTFLTVKLPK